MIQKVNTDDLTHMLAMDMLMDTVELEASISDESDLHIGQDVENPLKAFYQEIYNAHVVTIAKSIQACVIQD